MFGSKSKEIARLKQEISNRATGDWQDHLRETELIADLATVKEEVKDWIADYQQLNDRYTLLDSLLKQLRVNVTLPAKKIARQN